MLVSIIIPTYNRSQMLAEALDSVCSQNWPPKEIIVVDDGSTDGTGAVVRRFITPSPLWGEGGGEGTKSPARNLSINYIHTKNCGVSHARNVGIKRARGELIAFLDSDDIWLPGKLKRQVEYFEKNPDISICQTEEIWIRNGRRVNPRQVHKKYSGWIFDQCIPRCIVSPSAVMIRREVFDDIGLFDEAMPVCEDYDLWLRAALGYQIITLPEPLIIKRGGHPDQLSSQWGQDIWRIHALEKILNSGVEAPKLSNLIKEDICRRAAIIADGARKRGKFEIVEKYRSRVEHFSIVSG